VKKQEYVDAGALAGLRALHLLRRHIIPNVMGPVIVYCTLTVPAVMLLEAFISFLGLGVQRPQASWGVLIKEARASMSTSWWLLFIPAFFFSLTLFCLNFLGDGLRDALDPALGTRLEPWRC
jgi:oligopeptide transport system permease protein